MNALGMISQRLMAHSARHCVTFRILHQEPNTVLFQVLVLEARERHLCHLTSIVYARRLSSFGPLERRPAEAPCFLPASTTATSPFRRYEARARSTARSTAATTISRHVRPAVAHLESAAR
jgi:hypothetical protein